MLPRIPDPLFIKPGLATRLNLSIATGMILIIGAGLLWSVHDVRKSVHQEARAGIHLALALIDAEILKSNQDPAALQEWIKKMEHLDRIRHLRIAVTQTTDVPDWFERVDIGEPFNQVPGWFRWAVAPQRQDAVREIHFQNVHPIFIHIQSHAEDEIREAWEEMKAYMLLQTTLLFAISLSVYFIVRRSLKPVEKILQGLDAIEAGHYETTLPSFTLPELNRISQSINHLSGSLKESRDEIRALTRHSLFIQEEERKLIARDIHDEFGQKLTAIKMMSGMIATQNQDEMHATSEIQTLCDQLFSVVRSLLRRLRPNVLEDLGLLAALSELRDHWQSSDPACALMIHCDPSLEALKEAGSLEIYRIVQEALTNIHKHSRATQADVAIRLDGAWILLTIRDNGVGLSSNRTSQGFGLIGMRERVSSLGGCLELCQAQPSGLEIRVQLPFQSGHHHDG